MSNATADAILDSVRAQLPGVGDDQLKLELFNTIDELAREALNTTAPTGVDNDPATWLDSALWVPNYQALLSGTLFRLYAQVGKPWASADLAKAHADRYGVLLQLSRGDRLQELSTSTYQRLLNTVRVQMPQARESFVSLALFEVVNKIRVDALGLAPLANGVSPASWLPNWEDAFRAALYGTLVALQTQTGQPWSNPTLAAANQTMFLEELQLLRTDTASTPTTVYQRLLNAIRVQLPQARESAVTLAAFTIANKVRLDALGLAPLTDANTNPSGWLPSWDDAYQAMFYGTLTNLQMQTAQPWSNPAGAAANHALFLEELQLLRGDQAEAVSRGLTKIMDLARVRLPGARDNILQLELFAVMNQFFQDSNCWYEDIDFDVNTTTNIYYVTPTSVSSPIRLLGVVNSNQQGVSAGFALPDTIKLAYTPSQADTYTCRIALTVNDPVTREGYPEFPDWILDKYNNDILEGLLGRMMSQMSKPYSNKELGAFHLRNFKAAISQAKVESERNNVYRNQNWRFPQSFNRRTYLKF